MDAGQTIGSGGLAILYGGQTVQTGGESPREGGKQGECRRTDGRAVRLVVAGMHVIGGGVTGFNGMFITSTGLTVYQGGVRFETNHSATVPALNSLAAVTNYSGGTTVQVSQHGLSRTKLLPTTSPVLLVTKASHQP